MSSSQPSKSTLHLWTELCPIVRTSNCMTKLNFHQILVASRLSPLSRDNNDADGVFAEIHLYDAHRNEWSRHAILQHPRDHLISMAIDETNQKCFILYAGQLYAIDATQTISQVPVPYPAASFDYSAQLLIVDGIAHIIGGLSSTEHLTWNPNSTLLSTVHDFDPFYGNKIGLIPSLIYVASKQQIFMIGSYMFSSQGKEPIGIWIFCLKQKRWTKANHLRFEVYGVSSTLNAAQTKIIISGGKDVNYRSLKSIYILDIDHDCIDAYTLYKSSVCVPRKTPHFIMALGGERENELLVIGWLRMNHGTGALSLPLYMCKLMLSWYAQEELHWMECVPLSAARKQNEHRVIAIKHILN